MDSVVLSYEWEKVSFSEAPDGIFVQNFHSTTRKKTLALLINHRRENGPSQFSIAWAMDRYRMIPTMSTKLAIKGVDEALIFHREFMRGIRLER